MNVLFPFPPLLLDQYLVFTDTAVFVLLCRLCSDAVHYHHSTSHAPVSWVSACSVSRVTLVMEHSLSKSSHQQKKSPHFHLTFCPLRRRRSVVLKLVSLIFPIISPPPSAFAAKISPDGIRLVVWATTQLVLSASAQALIYTALSQMHTHSLCSHFAPASTI